MLAGSGEGIVARLGRCAHAVGPASAGWHASKRAGLAVGAKSDDVPAEVSEFFVDALESHGGDVWAWAGVYTGRGRGILAESAVLKS